MALPLLLLLAAALLLLGPAARVLPAVHRAGPVLCAAAAAVALAGLAGVEAAGLAGLRWRLDGVSGLFLAVLFLHAATEGLRPAAAGAAALALLGADVATVALPLAGLCALQRGWRVAGAGACLVLALLVLASQHGASLRFADWRPAALDGARGAVMVLLTGLGAGLLVWGGLGTVGLYLAARLLLGLSGPATPLWWAAPVLLLGAALAGRGAWRAARAEALYPAVADGMVALDGLALCGIGAALAARGADLLPLSAMAMLSTALIALSGALSGGVLRLCAGAVAAATAGTALAGLGGLARPMPGTALAAVIGGCGLAGLPPFAGFAGVWLLLQSLLATARFGGLAMQVLVAACVAGVGLAVALLAAAALRWVGLGFLGRARPPATGDAPRRVRLAMAGVAAALLLLGAWPRLGVLLARPAVEMLSGAAPDGLGPAAGMVMALLAGAGAAVALASWAMGGTAARRVPAPDGRLVGVPGLALPPLRRVQAGAPTMRGGLALLAALLAGSLVWAAAH